MDRTNLPKCADVARELGLPTGQVAPDALADHLDHCPTCADLAEQSRRLDAWWEATRPAPPSDAFAALWPAVLAQAKSAPRLVAATTPATAPDRRPLWTRAKFVTMALAQAAAVLVGVLWMTQDRASARTLVALNDAAPAVIDIEPSEVLIIRSQPASAEFERREFEDLRVSETETVGFDTSLLAYFEARGSSETGTEAPQ